MRKLIWRMGAFALLAALLCAAVGCAGPRHAEDGGAGEGQEQTGSAGEDGAAEENGGENSPSQEPSGGESGAAQDPTDGEDGEIAGRIVIEAGGEKFAAVLYDTAAAGEFAERLPLTLDMRELNGNEKYFYLSEDLTTDASRPGNIRRGDLMLYGPNCVVLFYKDFETSYSYTPLGRIENAAGLESALGNAGVSVSFTIAV